MSHDELALMLAKVSEELAGQRDEAVTTARTCELAVQVVDACDHATIALRARRDRFTTVAASSDLGRTFDELQYELDEGPILWTAVSDDVCRTNDVADDERWPAWGPGRLSSGLARSSRCS